MDTRYSVFLIKSLFKYENGGILLKENNNLDSTRLQNLWVFYKKSNQQKNLMIKNLLIKNPNNDRI